HTLLPRPPRPPVTSTTAPFKSMGPLYGMACRLRMGRVTTPARPGATGDLQPNPTLGAGPRLLGATEDERLLSTPTVRADSDFTHTDPWRVMRITGEFVS